MNQRPRLQRALARQQPAAQLTPDDEYHARMQLLADMLAEIDQAPEKPAITPVMRAAILRQGIRRP